MSDHNFVIGRALRPRGPVAVQVQRQTSGDLTLLQIAGELDLLTVSRLASELDDEVRHGDRDVLVDLRELHFIDSSGLHVLLNARRRLGRQGRALGVVSGPGEVRRLFELSRLLETLDVVSSVREFRARRAQRRSQPEPSQPEASQPEPSEAA